MNTYNTEFQIFISRNRLKKTDVASYLGVSNAFVTQLTQGLRDIPEDKLALIKANDNGWDISMFGEGSMLKSEVDAGAIMVADNEEAYKKAIESGMSLIPEYSTPYHGGDGIVSEVDHVVAYWSMPNIPSNSRIITMYGDSMSPYIRSGSKLAIQPISFSNPMEIPFGNVFALSVRDDWGQVSTHVKIIRRHNDKAKEYTHWIARSVNRDNYDDFDIDISRVMSLSIMVAFVNRAL